METKASVTNQFRPVQWDARLEDHLRQLIRLAVREDLERWHDWTTLALVPPGKSAAADVVARQAGVVAGLQLPQVLIHEMEASVQWVAHTSDGQAVEPHAHLGTLQGAARDILACERLLLNLLGRMCGIATLTAQYVAAVAGTRAAIYDTRKTMPGLRRLDKYAVRCGGGHNHRTGLYDGVLIKDNHLSFFSDQPQAAGSAARAAVEQARQFLAAHGPPAELRPLTIEVEVDTLQQLREVLPAAPDIVLLDNMSISQLREAVALRDATAPQVVLEASGGIQLETVGTVATTGVDRISVGALTHSAAAFDVGLDWVSAAGEPQKK